MLRDAASFAQHGGTLIHVDFDPVRVQHFGHVAIIYSHYSFVAEESGNKITQSGRAMELLVFEDGR